MKHSLYSQTGSHCPASHCTGDGRKARLPFMPTLPSSRMVAVLSRGVIVVTLLVGFADGRIHFGAEETPASFPTLASSR
ncbi:hypothetical protein [Agrobacterium sp.]|uniref:hypothetical protein n=1 Tax=Agrobacterium sp. TaxID=361 RepID=UPI0028B255AB|nr:hypothetical protein [Agrobacterium sp.]